VVQETSDRDLLLVAARQLRGPLPRAGALDCELEAIGLGNHRVYRQRAQRRVANWKLIIDAFLEVYHVRRLHAGTIGPFFVDAVSVNDSVGCHVRSMIARETTPEIRGLPPQQWNPQVHATLVHFIFPNSVLIYHPDYISHLGMFPEGTPPHWNVYFNVEDVDASVAKAEELGAKSAVPAMDVPGVGRMAMVGDPQGAMFWLMAAAAAA